MLDFDSEMHFEPVNSIESDSEIKPDFIQTIIGAEEQKYLEELKERHKLAPERNSVEYSKFVTKYQIEYLREDIAERRIVHHSQNEHLLNEMQKFPE